jgi:hypothetical protein
VVNILIAFPFFKGAVRAEAIEHQASVRLLIDSGAFSAWRTGKVITLDDYCRFLDSIPVKPWRYFTLDVVGDPAGSMRNYETMLHRGYTPVPIFTRGEDPSVLDDYYKTSDVVGICGLVYTKGNKGFIKGIMQHVGDRKVHWLGFGKKDYLKFYRPYMCDTSEWGVGARFGEVELYLGHGKSIRIKKSEFTSKPSDAVSEAIKRFGYDPYQLRQLSEWHAGQGLSRKLCAASAVALSADIERNLGTKYFMATLASDGLSMLVDAATRMQTDLRRAA